MMNKSSQFYKISQSTINWATIKNIYLQGAKKVYAPIHYSQINHHCQQPPFDYAQVQQNIRLIVEEISKVYHVFLQQFQKIYHYQMNKLEYRFIELKQTIRILQNNNKQIKKALKRQQNQKQYNFLQKNNKTPQKQYIRNKSYIHIQQPEEVYNQDSNQYGKQEEQISLLDQEHFTNNTPDIGFKSNRKMHNPLKEKEMLFQISKHKNVMSDYKLTLDNTPNQYICSHRSNGGNVQRVWAKEIENRQQQNKNRLQTKASSIFDIQSNSAQIQQFRNNIQSSLNIQLIPYPSIKPQKRVDFGVKNIASLATISPHEHLINQNTSLRLQAEKYRQELQNSSLQLVKIRRILQQGTQISNNHAT